MLKRFYTIKTLFIQNIRSQLLLRPRVSVLLFLYINYDANVRTIMSNSKLLNVVANDKIKELFNSQYIGLLFMQMIQLLCPSFRDL